MKFPHSKQKNLPIFIRTLFLHLNRLIQLAVRGTKVVIPFHVWFVHNSPSVRLSCLCLKCLCRDLPGAPPIEALSFPTVSFQLRCRPTGAGTRSRPANHRAAVCLSDSAVGRGALDKSERRKKWRHLTLQTICGCWLKMCFSVISGLWCHCDMKTASFKEQTHQQLLPFRITWKK